MIRNLNWNMKLKIEEKKKRKDEKILDCVNKRKFEAANPSKAPKQTIAILVT